MPREQASQSLIRDTPKHRIFRFPCREQHTMTRQRNTMKRRFATANRQPNFTSTATTRRSAITPTWRPRPPVHAKQHAEEAARAHMKNHLDDSH